MYKHSCCKDTHNQWNSDTFPLDDFICLKIAYTIDDFLLLTLFQKNISLYVKAPMYLNVSGASTRMTKASDDWLVHTAAEAHIFMDFTSMLQVQLQHINIIYWRYIFVLINKKSVILQVKYLSCLVLRVSCYTVFVSRRVLLSRCPQISSYILTQSALSATFVWFAYLFNLYNRS